MKSLLYAIMILFCVLVAVVTSSILISGTLKDIENKIERSIPNQASDLKKVANDFTNIKNDFSEKLSALSLLVSDSALLDIEHSFSDVINYAECESVDGVMTSIGRLVISIEHLRELAGLTVKSLF